MLNCLTFTSNQTSLKQLRPLNKKRTRITIYRKHNHEHKVVEQTHHAANTSTNIKRLQPIRRMLHDAIVSLPANTGNNYRPQIPVIITARKYL